MPKRALPIRIFLVGFPRSGTTLLQSLLSAHPQVISLPETFFFTRLQRPFAFRALKASTPAKCARYKDLAALDPRLAPLPTRVAIPTLRPRRLSNNFVAALDEMALANGRSAWLEKTPGHLRRLSMIERYVPDARIVHVVRDGVPAVISLHKVTRDFPQNWGGERPISECARRWQEDIRLSSQHADAPNHVFVSYERLVGETDEVMLSLLERLRLDANPAIVSNLHSRRAATTASITVREPWKERVADKIEDKSSAAASKLLSSGQVEQLSTRILSEQQRLGSLPVL